MGKRKHIFLTTLIATMALLPHTALAGMPAPVTLTEMARLRFEIISFFLAVMLVCAALIQLLWAGLRRSFTRLPALNYLKSLGLTALWGLLFMLILLMISGARELMTPGAWERDGAIYKLKDGGHAK